MGFRPMRSGHPDCRHKIMYATALEAGRAGEWATAKDLPGRWPYVCRGCGNFHLTSTEPAS